MNPLVEKFCTPPFIEISNFDHNCIASAEKTVIYSCGMEIPLYSWGEGKKVLLVHGWGSRASHMSFLARAIAEAGFTAVSFDAPAHSSTNIPSKKTSSMFDFGCAVSAAVCYLKDPDIVVAHSLGAIAVMFTVSGYMKFKGLEFYPEKVILVSPPLSLDSMISSYANKNDLKESEENILRNGLQEEFDFRIADYSIGSSLRNIPQDLLIIHDKDDEEIHYTEAIEINKYFPSSVLHLTNGLGHKKILFSRETIQTVIKFITLK